MRSIIGLLIVCLFLCPAIAATLAQKDYYKDVDVSADVVTATSSAWR
jgi:hypothetical protein